MKYLVVEEQGFKFDRTWEEVVPGWDRSGLCDDGVEHGQNYNAVLREELCVLRQSSTQSKTYPEESKKKT